MIGYLSGHILDISDTQILILTTSWVWYEVWINEVSYRELITRESTELYIYHHITESAQSLFGFLTSDEKKLFTELIKISGVGGKVALQILSLGKQQLIEAVQQNDKAVIESIKGIGKKMAEKIVLELKDKDFVKHYVSDNLGDAGPCSLQNQISLPADTLENIKSTLQNMWYQTRDIERVLQGIPEDLKSVEQILPYMIREL